MAVNISHDIRIVTIGGEPWFVAADVCRALGFPNLHAGAGQHLRTVPMSERRHLPLTLDQGLRTVTASVVSEAGLYRLVLRSDKPQARAFQDWVTRDVLLAIRKTGSYVMGALSHSRSG